nr:hypothetical protein [Tanacetum cinerariifolium]
MEKLPVRAQRHPWLRYEVEGYTEKIVHDFEGRLDTIFGRQVNRVHILDFEGLTEEMREALTGRLRMVYTRAEGQVLFTIHAWRRVFEVQGSLRQFILALGLHTEEEMVRDGFEAYWVGSLREIADNGDLSDYWSRISLDALTISKKGQAHEKVTATDLFYLRSMDKGTMVNVPSLLAQYLFRHAEGRKHRAKRLGDTWAWVALGPERQSVATAGAPEGADCSRMARLEEEVHGLRESLGEQREILDVMSQDFSRFTTWMAATPATRTMPQRMAISEEEVYRLHKSLGWQRKRCTKRRINDASTSTPQHPDP